MSSDSFETTSMIHEMKEGIMYMYVKPGAPDMESIKESTQYLKSLNQKLLIYCDPTDAVALDKDQRQYLAEQFNDFVIAFAMKNTNMMVPLVFSLISKFNKLKFPMKMFKTEEAAIKWLNTFK